MLPLLSFFLRRRALAAAGTATATAAATLAPTGAAQAATLIAPGVYSTSIPIYFLAFGPVLTEAVMFQGTGTIVSRLSTDPDTGTQVLLATFDTTGIVGTGTVTQSRYPMTSVESMVLPHTAMQAVSLSFPLEPTPTSLNKAVRTVVADMTLAVDLATGAVLWMPSGTLRML